MHFGALLIRASKAIIFSGQRVFKGRYLHTEDFNYELPPELIAQKPIEPRDTSRLLVINRQDGAIEHHHFADILSYLHAGDVMVFNDSRVIPARLSGTKLNTGGSVEILLLRRLNPNIWETLVKPGRRIKTGTILELKDGQNNSIVTGEVIEEVESGIRIIKFSDESLLTQLGKLALPPYIHEPL